MANYRIKHAETATHIVYRRFTYKQQKQLGMIGFLSVVLMSIGIFLVLPTPEDIISIGAIAEFLVKHYGIANGKSILYALIISKGTGGLLILISLLLGGTYIKNMMLLKMVLKPKKASE